MKSVLKKIFAVMAIAFLSLAAKAQTGTWSGRLDVHGMKLALVFHLDDGNPTMDSPDQGARGIPVQVVRGEAGMVTARVVP